jgi:hydrogenase maturation protein HypF
MHPEYLSTKHAGGMAGAQVVKVQHHHAHVAACMAEHGLLGEVIGVSFDGTGYGPDGTVWGGEFLVADYGGFRRVAHLAQVPMPGGAQAIKEPFRMAAAFLDLACDGPPPARVLENLGLSAEDLNVYAAIAKVRELSPLTSSAGRLFDAVAAIAGVARLSTFEGQAAMALEHAAAGPGVMQSSYQGKVRRTDGRFVIDTPHLVMQIVGDIAQGVPAAMIAKKFHAALASAVMGVCLYVKNDTGLNRVALSGGVFQNAIFSELCENALAAAGFSVFVHARLPPNDGGISAGQALVAREVARCASQYRCVW